MDGDNRPVYKWPVWRCLTGEFEFNGATYLIDEGDIFSISLDYLNELNESIAAVPLRADIPWPRATPSMSEDEFNRKATAEIDAALLMDKKLVSAELDNTDRILRHPDRGRRFDTRQAPLRLQRP